MKKIGLLLVLVGLPALFPVSSQGYPCPEVDPYLCQRVQWELVDHTFYTTKHIYTFRGDWYHYWDCGLGWGGSCQHGCYDRYRVDAVATYNVHTKKFAEKVTFTDLIAGAPVQIYLDSGTSPVDPWLHKVPGQNVDRYWESAGDLAAISSTMVPPLSFCAIAPGLLTQLQSEAGQAPPPPCNEWEKPPIINSPVANTVYPPGNVVPLSFEFSCKLDDYNQGEGPGRECIFQAQVELSDGSGNFSPYGGWISVPMFPAGYVYDLRTFGVKNETFPSGAYRLKARSLIYDQQGINQNVYISYGGEWSEWIYFKVGILASDLGAKKPELLGSKKNVIKPGMIDKQPIKKEGEQFAPGPPSEESLNKPDLTVEFGTLESDNPAYAGYYILFFQVKNRGMQPSAPTKLFMTCEKVGGGPCGFWFSPPFDIKELQPGAHQFFATEGLVKKPGQGIRYKFTGKADPDDQVDEGVHETNNTVVGFFPSIQESLSAGAAHNLNKDFQRTLQEKISAGQLKPLANVQPDKKLSSYSAADASKKEPFLAPSIILSGKRSYAPSENVMFALQGEPSGEPVLECSSDGLRWSANCPAKVAVRKIGSGAQVRYMVQASDPGKYRLRLGNALSEPFEVKGSAGLTANVPSAKPAASSPISATKTPTPAAAGAAPAAALKTPAAAPAPKLVPTGAPTLRLSAASFTAPAQVKPEVQADSRFKVKYMLEKKENGAFRKISDSDGPEFHVAEPGEYRIRAHYEGGTSNAIAAFTVKPKMVTAPAASQPQTSKIPAKTKMKLQ